jgi:asparagine synthase (glutamine-hydrolysing)
MCGISGVVSNSINPNVQNRFHTLFEAIKHRGPHGHKIHEGSYPNSYDKNFIFGHHRLAIIDLSRRADQPLISERGSILIINGEIYNSKELRATLKNEFNFKTTSDSEVVLAVLELYGIPGIAKLDGMFAFAFYPAGETSIWLGRDRLGIKPLYFARENEDIWFSSEAKPLAKTLCFPLDEIGLSEWVKYQFQVSDRTFFKGVYSVPPAHILIIKDGRIKSRQYWNFDDHLASAAIKKITVTEAIFELKELLEKSVRSHLASDVDVATITSGGLDSSSVSALAAKGGVRQAFIGRYLEAGYDESCHAKLVADSSSLDLKVVTISKADFFQALPKVASALDFPIAGPGSIGQYLVAEEISKSHRVVLAGTGGDELFLGYTRDQFPLWASQKQSGISPYATQLNPKSVNGYEELYKKFLNAGGLNFPILGFLSTIERNSSKDSLLSLSPERSRLLTAELLAAISPAGGDSLPEVHEALIKFEVKLFLPSLLHIEDRMTMAHSVESRLPLLDLNLIEFALSLPSNIRMAGSNPKDILRRAMKGIIPDQIIQRTDKLGFPVPLLTWLRDDKGREFSELLNSFYSREIPGITINSDFGKKTPSQINLREIWGAIILESWLRTLDWSPKGSI